MGLASEGQQRVAVTTMASWAALGETVKAVVTIEGVPDRRVSGVMVQLVRGAIHRYTLTNAAVLPFSDRGYHDWVDDERAVISETPVGADGAVPGTYLVAVRIPADGLPSAVGQVRWWLRAVIGRRFGHDVTAEASIEVLSGPQRFAGEAAGPARYVGEQCAEIAASPRTLRAGQSVTGTVTLRPARAVTVAAVRVFFEQTVSEKGGMRGTALGMHALRTDPVNLEAGDTRELPFAVTLPVDAAPTVRGTLTTPHCHAAVAWEIGAQVEIAASTDGHAAVDSLTLLGLNVYNTRPGEARSTGDVGG